MRNALALALLVYASPAAGHDAWMDGSPVPGWVKSECCGVADAHRLAPSQINRNADGDYVIDIYPKPIPAKEALPSQDGNYWAFFSGSAPNVTPLHCFFAPMSF